MAPDSKKTLNHAKKLMKMMMEMQKKETITQTRHAEAKQFFFPASSTLPPALHPVYALYRAFSLSLYSLSLFSLSILSLYSLSVILSFNKSRTLDTVNSISTTYLLTYLHIYTGNRRPSRRRDPDASRDRYETLVE
jgi:hypothetical protein